MDEREQGGVGERLGAAVRPSEIVIRAYQGRARARLSTALMLFDSRIAPKLSHLSNRAVLPVIHMTHTCYNQGTSTPARYTLACPDRMLDLRTTCPLPFSSTPPSLSSSASLSLPEKSPNKAFLSRISSASSTSLPGRSPEARS